MQISQRVYVGSNLSGFAITNIYYNPARNCLAIFAETLDQCASFTVDGTTGLVMQFLHGPALVIDPFMIQCLMCTLRHYQEA